MPTTLDHGIVVMASDLEPADLYGTNTRLGESTNDLLASVVGANRLISANQTFTNPTTNTLFPAGVNKTALTTTLEKLHDGTFLEIHLSGTIYVDSGTAVKVTIGLRIGGVDYDIATQGPATTAAAASTLSGHLIVSGVAAGSKTIEPFVRTAATATVTSYGSGGDRWSYTVREL